MDVFKVMIFAIIAALLGSSLRQFKSSIDVYMSIAAVVFIMIFITSKLSIVLSLIYKLENIVEINSQYIKILLKIVGISYITQFSSDICRECGYVAVANQVQVFGKIAAMAISMPIVLALIDSIIGMI